MSYRAVSTLQEVDLIAAEDTRHSKPLMQHYQIDTPMWALHDHNEAQQSEVIVEKLKEGLSVALISDAGTPLISDPGYTLVNHVREAGFNVVSIPGACALVAAISIAGLPTDKFSFFGFLPSKQTARESFLAGIKHSQETCAFYESTHRIVACLQDMSAVLGDNREVAIVKELTKKFERVLRGPVKDVLEVIETDSSLQKGEFVVLVKAYEADEVLKEEELTRYLRLFLKDLPLKQAVKMAVELTGLNKNEVYQKALQLRDSSQ